MDRIGARLDTGNFPHWKERAAPRKLRFVDLEVGEKFWFMSEVKGVYSKVLGDRLRFSGALGPWIKVSPRKYRHAEGGPAHTIGRKTVKVTRKPFPHGGLLRGPKPIRRPKSSLSFDRDRSRGRRRRRR